MCRLVSMMPTHFVRRSRTTTTSTDAVEEAMCADGGGRNWNGAGAAQETMGVGATKSTCAATGSAMGAEMEAETTS